MQESSSKSLLMLHVQFHSVHNAFSKLSAHFCRLFLTRAFDCVVIFPYFVINYLSFKRLYVFATTIIAYLCVLNILIFNLIYLRYDFVDPNNSVVLFYES